jgi:type III secretion protein U
MAEKTEKPTPKHLREARRKGQIARSSETQSTAVFVSILIYLWLGAGGMWTSLKELTQYTLVAAFREDFNTALRPLFGTVAETLFFAIAPMLIVGLLAAVLAGVAQSQGIIAFDPVTPQMNRLNPAEGLKRIFSKKTLATFGIMLTKFLILCAVIYWVAKRSGPDLIRLYYLTPDYIALAGAAILLKVAATASILFIFMAGLDIGMQQHWYMKDMRQDKDEVKRDMKDMQGDPLIKGQRRALAMQLLFESLQNQVKKANVVVVNPTHIAIALYYEAEVTPLPIVIAKGQDEAALVIRSIAEQENIPIVHDVPLARRLFEGTPMYAYVSDDTFDAVAEIIVWARALKAKQNPGDDMA